MITLFLIRMENNLQQVEMQKLKNPQWSSVGCMAKHPSCHQRSSLLHYLTSSLSLYILCHFKFFLFLKPVCLLTEEAFIKLSWFTNL